MAMSSIRLRRAVTAANSTLRRLSGGAAILPPSPSSPHKPSSVMSQVRRASEFMVFFQSRAFRSSTTSLLAARGFEGGDEIGPDTILFEGCDYNHWLIVMDFPKDNKPSPEEMVRTYEETCAKGLNISIEDAKQKMYACSTTTYTGFQAVMTEEESEKFNGLPGVIFVLPDSYIDPQNKEYGGDKYMNGTIIPRPPPIQYGRQTGRYRDQPRYDRPRGPMPNQDVNPQHGQAGPGYGPPRPNSQGPNPMYGAPPMPPNQQAKTQYAPQFRPPPPPQQPSYPPPQQNYPPPGGPGIPYQQGRGGPPPPPQYPGNYNHGGPGNNYNQGGPGNYNQGGPGNYNQGGPGNYNQGGPGNYNQDGPGNYYPPQGDQRNYGAAPPPLQGDQRSYGAPPPPASSQQGGFREEGNYGQGSGGYQGQGGFGRN